MKDKVGNEIKVGDRVTVTYLDASCGAHLWMTQSRMTVAGFGRTRVILTGSFNGQVRVGPRPLLVVEAVDARILRTPNQQWEEDHQ